MEEKRNGLRVILFPLPLQGCINPMLQLANILHSRGFSITVIHTRFNAPKASSHPLFTFLQISDGLSETQTKDGPSPNVMSLLAQININAESPFRDCLRELLLESKESERVSCLIDDCGWLFTQTVAESLNLPRLVLCTFKATFFNAYPSLPLIRTKGYLPVSVKFPKKPLSHTFAEQFVKICNRSDLSWELFTCERIRSSCARIYSRSDLISSTPPSSPAVATNMSPLSYREEKRLQKEREKAREAREKEDKARMVKALDDGKSRSSSGKGKTSGTVDPVSESKTSDHRDQKRVSSGKDIVRISDSRSSRSSREKEISEGGHSATSSRKRRNEESEVPPLHRKSRSRMNDEKNPSEDAGTGLESKPEEKEDSQRAPESDLPTQLLVLPSRDSENRESVRQEIPIPTAPPKSPADFMRNFTPVGMRIPPFSELKEVNRANYFRFADKLGELMLEYNTTFSCHESQLFPVNELDGLRARVAELEDEIRQLKEMEEENARAVAKANEIRERMLEAEGRCNLLELLKTDLSEKLKIGKNLYLEACDKITSLEAEVQRSEEWCKVAAEKRDEELAAAKKEERMRLRELYSGLTSKHETYYKAISDNEMIGTRLAETRANRELLEEILKGEIPDIKAELESVRKDEEEAEKKAREVSALRPQPNEFAHLFVATPPEPVQEESLPEDDVAINEFGTNKDLMAGQDFEAAVLPEDPDVKDQ